MSFAGTITKNRALTESMALLETSKQPWQTQEKSAKTIRDENAAMKSEETMNQIATDFCVWLKHLPGEDKTVNNTSDLHIR